MRVKMMVVGVITAFVFSVGVMIGSGENVHADAPGCSEFLEFIFGAPPYDSEVGTFVSDNAKNDPGRWAEIVGVARSATC